MPDGIWIIPARAGFTSYIGSSPLARGDHPRSRGVYDEYAAGDQQIVGSSPLARGLLLITCRPVGSMRIIPARAGFTHPHKNRRS